MTTIKLSDYLFKPKFRPLNCLSKLPNNIQISLFKHYLNDRDRFMMDIALKRNLRSVSETEMNRARENQIECCIETEKWNLYDYRDNIECVYGKRDFNLVEEEEYEEEEYEEEDYYEEEEDYYGYMYEMSNL